MIKNNFSPLLQGLSKINTTTILRDEIIKQHIQNWLVACHTGLEEKNRYSTHQPIVMKKTLHRDKRLKSGAEWVKTYSGKHIVQGYSKRYGVNKLCAVKELRMIGIEISEEYENQLIQSIEVLKRQRQLRKDKNEQELNSISDFDNDENFALIIGYTSAGFPYGITHEEMAEIDKNELE